MKHFLFCLFLIIACTQAHDSIATNTLVGHWTFEKGSETKDLTGNFANIVLKGAQVTSNGKLDVGQGKWAIAPSYTGPTIFEKTLVSWVSLQSTSVRAGSALTIDKISVDEFDAIVYSERQLHRWMPGSSNFKRTVDPNPGYAETVLNVVVQVAITYQNVNGKAHVRIYRNGNKIGGYTKGNMASWPRGDAEVFWGLRHGSINGGPGNLDALIEESRIYNTVLTQEELRQLKPYCD